MYQLIQNFNVRHFPSSTHWALDILNVQLLKSSSLGWGCSNALTLLTHGKNKLWKRTRIALEHLLFLTYGVKLPTLILPLMSNLCSLGAFIWLIKQLGYSDTCFSMSLNHSFLLAKNSRNFALKKKTELIFRTAGVKSSDSNNV